MTKKEFLKAQKQNAIKSLLAPCKKIGNQFSCLLEKMGVNPINLRKIA